MAALTDQQQRAVLARGVSVALSAGAGCGKTFVLTERFLRELEPSGDGAHKPAELSQIVAITFTERAARQMRDRIRAACRQRLLDAPAGQAEHWLGLLRDLDWRGSARSTLFAASCSAATRSRPPWIRSSACWSKPMPTPCVTS